MSIQRMGDRDVIQIDRLMSLSQEAVQGVVHRLHAAIHCSGLYPPGHTLFHKRIQALHECLERLFLEAELLVIRCGQTLSINHTLLHRDAPENENSRKVSTYMRFRGVKNIVLWPGVQGEELGQLLEMLHSANEEAEEESSYWIRKYHSARVRLNMPLVTGKEVEAARQGVQRGQGEQVDSGSQHSLFPVDISQDEVTALLSNIGPFEESEPAPSASSLRMQGELSAERHHLDPEPFPGGMASEGSFSTSLPFRSGDSSSGAGPHSSASLEASPLPIYSSSVSNAYGTATHERDSASRAAYSNTSSGSLPLQPTTSEARGVGSSLGQFSPAERTNVSAGLHSSTAAPTAQQAWNHGAPADDLQTNPVPFEINPMEAIEDLYDEVREEKTVIQRMPAGFMEGVGAGGGASAKFATEEKEVPNLDDDLPSVQGYVIHESYSDPDPYGLGDRDLNSSVRSEESRASVHAASSRESSYASHSNVVMGKLPESTSQPGLVDSAHVQAPSASGLRESVSSSSFATGLSSLPSDWVSADPASLDQSQVDFSQLDFGKIEPCSLFRSKRFQQFLRERGVELFLSRFLSSVMESMNFTQPDYLMASHREFGWVGTAAGQALLNAVEQLDDLALQQNLLQQMAQTISSSALELLHEQLGQMRVTSAEEKLRKAIIQQLSPKQRSELVGRVANRLQNEKNFNRIDGCVSALTMLAEETLEEGGWRPFVPVLELLAEWKTDTSVGDSFAQKVASWFLKMATPAVGRLFFQHLLRSKDKDVRKYARRGILAMGAASAYSLTMFMELANDSRDEKILLSLVRDIGKALNEVEQTLFFDQIWETGELLPSNQRLNLGHSIFDVQPSFVEKHIIEKLKELESAEYAGYSKEDWVHWCELALHCHTPRLRQYLGRYLQQRKFVDFPSVEERLLNLLDGHGTLQGFQFLEHIVHNDRMNLKEKTSAVWLVGCLKSEEAFLLLRKILLERRRFLRQPVYHNDMRYQALDALRHFPQHQIVELIKKVVQDPEPMIRDYAQIMLKKTLKQ